MRYSPIENQNDAAWLPLVLWTIVLGLLFPRLGDSSPQYSSTEFRETQLAQEDASIRVAHSRELLGKSDRAKLAKDLHSQVYFAPFIHELTKRSLKGRAGHNPQRVSQTILEESRRHRFDPVFLLAVIERESSFHPNMVGTHGEIGLMQVRPVTGEWIAKKYHLPWRGDATLRDPVMNIRIGAAYFAFLRENFKSRGQLYLTAYNLGPRRTRESMSLGMKPKEYSTQVMKNFFHLHKELKHLSTKHPKAKSLAANS